MRLWGLGRSNDPREPLDMSMEDELKPLVDPWRTANLKIVEF